MTDPPIDDTQAREQDAPGTHDAKRRAPVHGHTGDLPSDKALSDTRGRSWTDLVQSPDRRGCGCEFLQGWLPCWLLALHHVWHAIRSRTRQPHRRSSTRLFALSAAGAFSGGIWPIRHPSPQLRRSTLLVSSLANECRRNHPPSPPRLAT
eukprot:scaffold23877_cov145-Isochrysis_galbana.AAC.4